MPVEFDFKARYGIEDLISIMALLRGENGCPWDRAQTHGSIRKNLIEETYEVVEAIDLDDSGMLREELGDLLMQVLFHSRMEEEAGRFDFSDVCNELCLKLITRHPHVFGDVRAETASEVLRNWEDIKQRQKGQTTATETLQAVPKQLPALMRSTKVQHRAAKVGFDYSDTEGALRCLEGEVEELGEAVAEGDSAHCDEELGDVLFAAVNVARFLKVDAEESLTKSCEKFIRRFSVVEKLAAEEKVDMSSADMDKLDELWGRAKKLEKQKN